MLRMYPPTPPPALQPLPLFTAFFPRRQSFPCSVYSHRTGMVDPLPTHSAGGPQRSLAPATRRWSSPPPLLQPPEARRRPRERATLPPLAPLAPLAGAMATAAAAGGPTIGTAPAQAATTCAFLSGPAATAAGRAGTGRRPRRASGKPAAAAEGEGAGWTGSRWWPRCTGLGFSWGE